MSREIKFRVWDNILRNFEDSHENWESESEELFTPPRSLLEGALKRLSEASDRYVVEQFIGLHDKNGKPIYEGDIVKNFNWIGVVKYNVTTAQFYITEGKLSRPGELMGYGQIYWDEVIGNLHQNPDLLT